MEIFDKEREMLKRFWGEAFPTLEPEFIEGLKKVNIEIKTPDGLSFKDSITWPDSTDNSNQDLQVTLQNDWECSHIKELGSKETAHSATENSSSE